MDAPGPPWACSKPLQLLQLHLDAVVRLHADLQQPVRKAGACRVAHARGKRGWAALSSVALNFCAPRKPVAGTEQDTLAAEEEIVQQLILKAWGRQEENVPPSPAAEVSRRGGPDDEWYLERRVSCCICRRTISSAPEKAGRRCTGCRRWYHDRCAPSHHSSPGSQPAAAASSVGGDGWFDCEACRVLRQRLRAAAVQSAEARGAGLGAAVGQGGSHLGSGGAGSTVVLLDLVEMRQAREEQRHGGRNHARGGGGVPTAPAAKVEAEGGGKGSGDTAGAAVPFKPSPVHRNLDKRHAAGTAAGVAGPAAAAQPERLADGELRGDGKGSPATTAPVAPTSQLTTSAPAAAADGGRQLLCGAAAQRDLAAVARIFSRFTGDGGVQQQEQLLEADYALLCRGPSGRPVAAASLLVFGAYDGPFPPLSKGSGHARIQALATLPEAQRQGHARAVLHEAARVLGAAGVPRLVLAFPTPQDREAEEVERAFRRRLGFQELELPLLAEFKRWFVEYDRDLTRGMEFLQRPNPPMAGSGPGR